VVFGGEAAHWSENIREVNAGEKHDDQKGKGDADAEDCDLPSGEFADAGADFANELLDGGMMEAAGTIDAAGADPFVAMAAVGAGDIEA
jgi:hypothetical protein